MKSSIQIHTKKGEAAIALGYCITLCNLAHIHAIQYQRPLVSFLLDAGTYYAWKQLAGYNFTNPEAFTVT